MNSHEHCRNCILKYCTTTDGCPLVTCKFGCGMKLHECKAIDHSSICQNHKVPCVNSYYGCPMALPRSQLGTHIQNCPASIILCTMEWGRNPLYSQERLRWVPFPQPNPTLVKGYLDVELALHDQKVISKMTQVRYKQGVAKKQTERHDRSNKLSYERAKSFQDEIKSSSVVESKLNSIKCQPSSVEYLKLKKLEEDFISSVETENIRPHNDAGVPECPVLLNTHCGLGLNINIEMIPKFGRHSFLYKVPCRQVLHRQEFPAHFKNVHSEIHGGLGWIEQRCPMAQYGCAFVYQRLLPSKKESVVVFSQDLGAFGVKPGEMRDDVADHCSLLYLPSEVLEEICKWLDGFSLNNLLLTCRTLHNHLSHLLHKHGVVTAQWKKRVYEDGSASWTIGNKVWSFTNAFSEVRHWVYSDSPGLGTHLEKCPYYQQYVPDEPFRYADVSTI